MPYSMKVVPSGTQLTCTATAKTSLDDGVALCISGCQ
jgi:hypothetical protein